MPQTVLPNKIEVSDFTLGWAPDFEEMSLPPNALLRVKNLLPNTGDGTLVTRQGYKRVDNVAIDGYTIRSIHPFNMTTGVQYLILVGTTGVAAASNNVKVWSYNIATETLTLISPTKTWTDITGLHYGFSVNNTFYGGTESDKMYSWSPGGGWDSDATSHSYPAFDALKAYQKGDKVSYSGSEYKVEKSNLPANKWEAATEYVPGDKIKVKAGAEITFSGWRCVTKHLSEAANKPGTGSGMWRRLKLDPPVDEDGRFNDQEWSKIPTAPETSLAVWWANRPWFRPSNTSRQALMYGHLVDQNTLVYDPTDYSTGSNKEGIETVTGAGFIPMKTGEGDELKAMMPYGSHLVVCSQKKTFVLTGENPETQYRRELAPLGCVGPRAICEHEGLVYIMSDEGLYFTDGTDLQPVPGSEMVTEWLKESVRWNGNLDWVTMWSADGHLWMSFPTGRDNKPDRTLVYNTSVIYEKDRYERSIGSFWPQDFAPIAVAVNRKDGQDRVFFSCETKTGTQATAVYVWTGLVGPRATSTQTISAVTTTNLFLNPSFESRGASGGANDWGTTTDGLVREVCTNTAARKGNKGLQLTNLRLTGETHEGVYQLFADESSGVHTAVVYARRPDYVKTPNLAPVVKFRHGVTDYTPVSRVKVGRGWWKLVFSYTGSVIAARHGFVVPIGRTVELDQALCNAGSNTNYFDGDGGESSVDNTVFGGGKGIVYMYGYETDAENNVVRLYTDDLGGPTYENKPIGWHMRTAWFPFGTVREERDVRKIWALVRGSVNTIVRGFSNYNPDSVVSSEEVPGENNVVQFLEGSVGDFPTSYSICFEVEGESSPAAVQGLGVDTKVRRTGRFGG